MNKIMGNTIATTMKVDDTLSKESKKPIQNKAVAEIMQQLTENSIIYNTVSSNTPIYDVNIGAENKGIKAIKYYGAATQAAGATLANPKNISCPSAANAFYICGVKKDLDAWSNRSLRATNKFKDECRYDFENTAFHFKFRIKEIVLDGTETYTKGGKTYSSWVKASSPEGRYFVNLHLIDGLFTADDLNRLNSGVSIAYDDAKCTIGNDYFYGNFTESGQFNITQGVSSNNGYFRFQFFAPEYETLDEVLAQVKKNPITLLIPMIYDVQESTHSNRKEVLNALTSYAKNPFSLYFIRGGFDFDTEVTYQLDVGLCVQNLKNAIIKLGGSV